METDNLSQAHDSDPHLFEAAWLAYRLRSRLFWLLFLSWVPVGAGTEMLCQAIGWWNHGEDAAGIMFPAWCLVLAPIAVWKSLWKCPRCSNSFFKNSTWRNPFATKYMHCSLLKWEGSSLHDPHAPWWSKMM